MAAREPGAPILWRRLDVPGHDAAWLRSAGGGSEIFGMAAFLEEGDPTALRYRVACDGEWRSHVATVEGWRGGQPVELRIRHDAHDGWTLNGTPCPTVAGCIDVDLSFTPATNLVALRRLHLEVGDTAEVRSAWLAWPRVSLAPLVQRYTRLAPDVYAYEADVPEFGRFDGTLRVEPGGWVLDYAGLWRAEERD